ncbi:hypothetical protein, conserved [Leishmania lindenbergi]|uniref:Uncharacterized protein n=1 Tax=Leishmania lindenbergi TaxID=651832 RepID=A0AAW2ZVU1_9TRYP
MSMLRVASISSENPPPPPDIQHIEGQLWYVKGKNGPGRKHASLQWVICEDQRLSIYSSWANSRRLIEEMCFERVHILFDFLHPHKHPEVLGSGAPQTRRLSIHRNEPRTTAELRYAFQIRDPCDVKTFAGYHYFGVEYVLRDLSTERLRRGLAIFCTDHPGDHRKWRDFWEEMQVRYPMVRNRSATSMPMDMSSELMSEFLLPSQAARREVEGQSKQDTDSVSSSCLPSPINQDDDSLTGTRTPEWTDSEHRQLHSRDSTPPPPFVLLGSTTTDGVHQNLLGNLRAGDEKVQAESIAQWIALLVDAERQAREGIELIEAATHSLLEANQKLHDLAYHVLPAATFPPSMGLACSKGEGSACDGTSGGVPIRDGDTIRALQAELKELLAALEEVKSAAAYSTSAPEALASAESVAASNQELLATYERELAELRAQNATLKSELDTHAAIATERVERALDEWTRAGVVDIADGDTAHEGSGRGGTNVVSPASRQRYLTADEALLRALVEAALGRESSTAAFAASSGSSSSAQVSTQDGSASDLQASHSALSTNANEHDGAITAGQSLGTASDSHQPWGALSRDARLSSAMSAAGALTASLPELVQQHLSTFAAEHDRRLGGPDSAASSSIEGVLYHVVDEVATAFNHMVDVPETVEGVSNADGSVAAPARKITAVSSWLSVLHRCLLHRVDVVEAVCATGTRDKSLLSAAEFGGSTADAGGAVDSTAAGDGAIQCRPPAAASSNTRRRRSLPPLTDEEISIIGDLRRSVHDLVAWILDLLAERQQYATSVAALDSMTCQHDVFQPLKEVQGELERTTARFEAAAAVESLDNVAYRHRGVTTLDILPLEAAAASSGADGDPEYSEKHTAGSSDTLKVEHRLKARLQHAMSAFDSACAEAVALRRLLTTILYGSEVPLRSADSTDGVVAAATTNAAAACEAFRAAQDAGIDGVDKLRGAAEASVAVRARKEVWANTLTPAVLQACADALVGGPCIQDVVHSLQLILGRCPEIDGSPKWVGGAGDVLPLSKESIWSLVQELHQRLAAEQARCNKLLGGVMLISASLASSESELLAAAYSTAMAATANASAMTDEALKSWAAYSNNSNEVAPEEQRCLHEPAETKANPRLSSFPAACGGENALHEAVHTDLVVTLTRAEGARDLRSAALDAACSLLPNLSARIAGTQTALWRLVGDLLLHGAGAGVPSLEVLLALPIVNHTGVPTAVDASEKDGVSLGDHMRVAGNAVEELLSGSEEAARGRREWMQQLLRWLKDFPLASASDAAPELASGLQCDASTAHEVYAQLLEELAAAESELMSRVGAVGALLRKTSCVHTISVPEMSNEAGGADIAVLAAAASADIAEALHVSEAHISVTEASVDPVQRVVQVSAIIAHHPHALTRAAVLGAVHACPCARLREALKDAPANSATTASSMNEQSTARPVTVDSPEGMDAVSCLSTSLLHRAAKIAAVVEFEKRVLALLPTAQDTAVANVRMSTIDAMPACKAGQTLAAMLATELDINPPEANFEVPTTVFPSLLQSLASYLQELHDIVLPVLHHRIINPEKASLEKLRTAVDALHDAAIEKMPHVALEQLSCIDNTTGILWPEALNTANLRDLHFIIDHLSTTAKQAVSLNFTDDLFHHLRATAESLGVPPDAYAGEWGGERVPTAAQLAERAGAVVSARAEEAAGLCSIAQSLGVPPDAYAGEWGGERVPTAAQLAERAGAVVSARAEEAAGLCSIAQSLGVPPDAYAGECSGEMTSTCSNVLGGIDSLVKRCKSADELASRSVCELQAAVSVLVKLWEAVEEAGVVTADLRDGWWAVGGLSRWEVGAGLICALSAAVEVSREEVGDVSERIKLFEEQLVDVERDQNESREAITAAVEKLRGGLEEVNAEDNGEMSPPSSCGSTVCGPLFASLRQLTSEVSDVASVLRRVKQVLEEHNAEEKCMPELEEMSFPASQGDGSDGLMAGKVVIYEDVVAGVRAKVDALRKERAKRLEIDSVLKNFLSAVVDQGSFTSEEPVSRPPSLTLRRCMKPKAKPQPADLDSSVTEEFALLRTPLHLPAINDSTATPLGRSGSIPVPLASWATGDVLEKVCHHMNEAENAVRIMRVAVAAAYEALGGEDDVVHASDDEAARLLVELARNTAVSIESVRSLLDPLERRDAPTGQRESLAQLMDRIKGKLGSSSGCSMPTVLQVVEEGMQFMPNEANSSRPSPRSSVNRHLPRKQKPVAPEVVGSESFSLTHQVTYSRDNSLSSLASTLRVLPLPPPGLPTSAEDFEKKIGCRMKELDALRRGCSIALRTLDSSLKVSDMDCDTMVMHLVGRCNDVQTAMQITDTVFEDDNMISELSSAKTLYSASNRSASEHPLLMRCSTLVSAVKSLSNVCESMRHTQANMAKQQRFLIHNEAQNTSEMRRALLELEEKLRDANAELMESHKVREATEKKAAEVSYALEMAQNQLSNLQNVRNDMEESLTQLKQQHDEDADELDRAEEKLNTLSNSVSRLQESLEVASDVVREEVLGACQRLHLAVIGREMPEPEIPAEGRSQELLLPALHVITKALQSAMEETTRFATRDKGIATAFAEERVRAAQQAAALRGELASVAEAKEVAEARAKATAKHLKQTEDAFEDEVAKLKRALRNSEAMLEDEEANHQRRLRQAQAAAEDQLAAVQRRLDCVMCVQAEEARLRVASEENVQKLRDALAEAESELARQQRHAAEDVMTQRKEDMRRIESLEADLAAARLHSNELAQALGRATHDGADAARALEASAQEMAQLAAELADTRAQLRTGNEELASICATIASTGLASSMTSSASLPAPPARATELLEGLLGHIAVLQRALETQEMVQQRRRTRGTQSEDFVAETLAAFTAIWAAAVKAGRAPARLNEEWLTPMDKADVVSNVLTRDDSPRLDDLAATRQRLLGLLCRSPLHYQGGSAALGPLENATTAALLQTYHEAMEGCYGAQQAALERELRDAHSKIQTLLARLQEQEEQHTIEAAEVEIRVGRMRAMVQSKLMADEIAEQRMRETEASVHRHFVL